MIDIIGSSDRKTVAKKFIRGNGIEIGALHFPTPLPLGAEVVYVDCSTLEILKRNYTDIDIKITDYVISHAEHLDEFKCASQDFVIANHVLEHLENPIRALHAIHRILKPQGIAMIALPDKNECFDRKRETTPLLHLCLDYFDGPEHSRLGHYVDWYQNSELEGLSGDALSDAVHDAMKRNQNIHFHVFDYKSMLDLFGWTRDQHWFSILNEDIGIKNGGEFIWILQKI